MKVVAVYNMFGSTGHILICEDGCWCCPVCAMAVHASVQFPWPETPVHATSSFDLCPRCWTQFGHDDYPDPEMEDMDLDAIWALCRKRWMEKSPPAPEVLKEVVDMLTEIALLSGRRGDS